MVRVIPKNDTIRKLLKHPVAGPFRSEGSSDWPDDSFTHRRVADGDVTIEEAKKPEEVIEKKQLDENEEASKAPKTRR
jgi:hypothetical protein